jgi:ceramide glucosyltransferase
MQAPDAISAALVLLASLALAGLAVTALADRALRRCVRRPPPWAGIRQLPPVSIVKPVKGLDDGLEENLLSLADQDYPQFEILVGAADADDPALGVARRVARLRPAVPIRIVVCPADGGLNPKVSILRILSARAQHDLQLVSDSNVRAEPGYLQATTRELGDPAVGLVTNLVAGSGERSTGATLEGLHLVTFVARATTFAAAHLDRACVVGKSMLFRRSQFQQLGGWPSVRDVLAEDYVIGQAYQRAGYRVVCSGHVIRTFNRDWPISRFVNRHLRWGQMRRRVHLPAYLLEPVLSPAPLILITMLLSLWTDTAVDLVLPLGALGIGLRLAADRALWRLLRGSNPPLRTLLLGLPKDLLVLGMWLVAGFRRTINWRGNVATIGAGTRLHPKDARRRQPGPVDPTVARAV